MQNFRNIALQELSFSPKINCITGNNGEGKTNLCDAIYYLSMTKSYSGVADRFNIRYGADSFALAGSYEMESGMRSTFSIGVDSAGQKRLKRDDKPLGRISDHIGTLPVVMVSPYDTALVSESGEQRRRFVNSVQSQMDREYLASVQQYNRILMQRNRLLKDGAADSALLDTFDLQLSMLADRIYRSRQAFVEGILPFVRDYYREISGGREEIDIEYTSDLQKSSLESMLHQCRERDRMFKYTTVGVQRDDFVFLMNGYPIRKCGSQGQQKSFLVALKFAQYDLMRSRDGYAPTLLLDDLFDKLDMGRVSNLLQMVVGRDNFGQIFLSDTNRDRLSSIVDTLTSERTYYEADSGVFKMI